MKKWIDYDVLMIDACFTHDVRTTYLWCTLWFTYGEHYDAPYDQPQDQAYDLPSDLPYDIPYGVPYDVPYDVAYDWRRIYVCWTHDLCMTSLWFT